MKLYYNILERVRAVEEKRGIKYAKTDGKLYCTLKVFYIIAFAYTMGINLLFTLGTVISEINFKNLKNSLITVTVFSVLLIASLVIMRFKDKLWANITSGVLNLLSSVGLLFSFAVLMEDSIGFMGLKTNFYWRHFIPLVLIIILSVWLTVIAVRSIIKTNSAYKKVVENIYALHKVSAEESNFTEEQWDEILRDYDPRNNKK